MLIESIVLNCIKPLNEIKCLNYTISTEEGIKNKCVACHNILSLLAHDLFLSKRVSKRDIRIS